MSGCAPQGEKLVHKPGKGAFYGTGLEEYLKARGITHLLFAGVTTEVGAGHRAGQGRAG
jgi:nicotinamidase-related amidase